jgi:hypothetical protein
MVSADVLRWDVLQDQNMSLSDTPSLLAGQSNCVDVLAGLLEAADVPQTAVEDVVDAATAQEAQAAAVATGTTQSKSYQFHAVVRRTLLPSTLAILCIFLGHVDTTDKCVCVCVCVCLCMHHCRIRRCCKEGTERSIQANQRRQLTNASRMVWKAMAGFYDINAQKVSKNGFRYSGTLAFDIAFELLFRGGTLLCMQPVGSSDRDSLMAVLQEITYTSFSTIRGLRARFLPCRP